MEQIWVFVIGVVLGALAVVLLKKKKDTDGGNSGETRPEKRDSLIEKQAREKEEHKKMIREFVKGKEKIYNNDIEKLLKVSNATAKRYLNELEKEGILKQIGEIGQGVCYEVLEQAAEQLIEEIAE
jgi:predicted HTH transcriptional regulator